jgi:hypothetical protein
MGKENLVKITVEEFRHYYYRLLAEEDVNFFTSFFASQRVERFFSIQEVFAHVNSKPHSRSRRALDLYKLEHANKINTAQSDFLSPSSALFCCNLISLSDQKKFLIQKLECEDKMLVCLQERSDTGSVWRNEDCVYKIFTQGCLGRSALEQARFESNAWNDFYNSFSPRYSSSLVETIENIPVMKTPYIRGVHASKEESLEIGIQYASKKKKKLIDLTKPGNCLKTPDNKIQIVDFGEQVLMSDQDVQSYILNLELDLRQLRGEFKTTHSADQLDYRFRSFVGF